MSTTAFGTLSKEMKASSTIDPQRSSRPIYDYPPIKEYEYGFSCFKSCL